MNQIESVGLYVGNLHQDVTEAILYERFSLVGPIHSIHVCRDRMTQCSLGYTYVNFQRRVDAEGALESMNFELIMGQPVRMWSQRDSSLRKSGQNNVFIKNLERLIDSRALYDTFSAFGSILSCKVACDEHGSKGYGFIHFEKHEAAERAIKRLNGMLFNDQKVLVGQFKSRKEREAEREGRANEQTNIYLKNFGEDMDDEKLKAVVGQFGRTLSVHVVTDESGKSRGFGFANFKRREDAQKAVAEMNGKEVNGKVIHAGRAQKKAQRQTELKRKFEQRRQDRGTCDKGVNLYVKHLDRSVDDERLWKEFSPFGTITSAKVMTERGQSEGFGFVCFSSPDEATKAVTEMNGRIVATKPLCVTLAQRREARQTYLANQCKQRIAGTCTVPNLDINSYQQALRSGLDSMAWVQNGAAYYPTSQLTPLGQAPHWAAWGVCPQDLQNVELSLPQRALPAVPGHHHMQQLPGSVCGGTAMGQHPSAAAEILKLLCNSKLKHHKN